MAENKTSASQLAASARYHAKMRTLRFYVTPELGDEIEKYCNEKGESMNSFIKRAIAEQMKRDNG